MPEERREVAAMRDGELWARRDAYAPETAWAPPYVAGGSAGCAHRRGHLPGRRGPSLVPGDAANSRAERAQARQQAENHRRSRKRSAPAGRPLAEVADARRRWHAATELSRQEARAAGAELRRRYLDMQLSPLHRTNDVAPAGHLGGGVQEPDVGQAGVDAEVDWARRGGARLDVEAGLAVAREAQKILTERERQAERDAEQAGDERMHRREAEAVEDALARRSAIRQDPVPSRRTMSLERDELELEAGHRPELR